jgi:hypothetical protein
VGLLLGIACLRFPPLWVLVALAGGGFALITLKRPEIGLLGILVATSSVVFEDRLPLIPIGIGSLQISDVVLLSLFGLIMLRWLAEPDFKIVRTPLDFPLLAFYGVCLLSTLMAILQSSVEFNIGFRAIRVVTYYLAFFVVTNLVREERQVRFLSSGLIVLGTIVAAAMIAQFVLGESLQFLPGRVETLSTQGTSYAGVFRILPPGQSLVLLAFVTVTVALVMNKFKAVRMLTFLQWALLGLVVVLTFNRSFWVAVLLALVLLFYLVRELDRQRIFGWGLVVMVLMTIVMLSAVGNPGSQVARVLEASFDRLATLADSQTLRESSLQMRYVEIEYAIAQIVSHPVIGLGLGARYRPWDPRLDWRGSGGSGSDGRAYIHNGHLWIMLASGLLGYFFFVWLSFAFLRRGLLSWRRIPDPRLKAIVLGLTLTYLGVVIGAVVNPMFMQWFWTPVIGIMMGTNEVAMKLAQAESVDEPATSEGYQRERV